MHAMAKRIDLWKTILEIPPPGCGVVTPMPAWYHTPNFTKDFALSTDDPDRVPCKNRPPEYAGLYTFQEFGP
jgi:hypothetical protein